MTAKCYYMTTLAAWQRHAARFANSHWLALTPAPDGNDAAAAMDSSVTSTDDSAAIRRGAGSLAAGASPTIVPDATFTGGVPIIVLVEADEGAHLALEDDAEFEALPHPLAQKPISDAAHAALASHGVAPDANTFDVAEAVAHAHPLLRYRVF